MLTAVLDWVLNVVRVPSASGLLQVSLCFTLEDIGLFFIHSYLLIQNSNYFLVTDCTKGLDAHSINGYIVHDISKCASVHIPYPSDGDESKGGCAFHHGRFVMKLRRAAQAEPK
jgi:hypothetical protein